VTRKLTHISPKKLKVLAIYSQISKALILEKLKAGEISGCGQAVPPMTVEDVEDSPTIVAQMGPEPFLQAMAAHPDFDIIIGGRAYDPVPYVAFCAYQALNGAHKDFQALDKNVLGGFMHMGKIMECGASCARPKTKSSLAKIYADGTFDVRPLDPASKCTPLSVAAHTLYEKPRPDLLYGPGGYLDLTATTYHQLKDGVSVRAQGGSFVFATDQGQSYTVKLEAAKIAGYRSIFIGNFHDQILIAQVRSMLDRIKNVLLKQNQGIPGLKVDFHVYGLDKKAVSLESVEAGKPEAVLMEVFVIGEVLADSQEAATTVASAARVACLHGSYPGQKATAGNLGMGIGGPLELECGPSAEFSIYHLMPIGRGEEGAKEVYQGQNKICNDLPTAKQLFTFEAIDLGGGIHQPRSTNGHSASGTKAAEVLSVVPSSEKQKMQFAQPPTTLGDIAGVVRSKNSGPFELTLDVIFEDADLYHVVKNSGLLTPTLIAKLYKLRVSDIIWCGFFDQALGFKATIPRTRNGQPVASGGFMEDDVHGSQKHLPLIELPLDAALRQALSVYTGA
jgi:hypothetical protein